NFRSAQDPERLRGPNLSGVWLDEASLMRREAYDIAIACLRQNNKMGWLSATFTPKGKKHWTFDVFGKETPDTFLVRSTTGQNPFLPPEFERAVRDQYTAALAAQELGGEFLDEAGYLFARGWFEIVDSVPATLTKVRAWDLAGTEPERGTDPDYTVGLLLGRS